MFFRNAEALITLIKKKINNKKSIPIRPRMKAHTESSLERNKPGWMGGTNTRPSVLDRLVGDWEFSQIMANHLRLDFHLIEGLSIVNTNNATNHFRNYNHVAQVRPNRLRFLTRWSLPFLFQDSRITSSVYVQSTFTLVIITEE